MWKDFKGNELSIGDKVIYTYKSGGSLAEATIVKITTQLYLEWKYTWNNKEHTGKAIIRASNCVYKLG